MWTKILKYLLIVALATWWWPFAVLSMTTHAEEITERDYNGDGWSNVFNVNNVSRFVYHDNEKIVK